MVVVALEPAWTDTLGGDTERAKSGSCAGVMVSETWAMCDRLPLVPVSVKTELPTVAVSNTDSVSVVPVALDVGLKVGVTPLGRPLTLKATLPVNPPLGATAMAMVPVEPCSSETLDGLADTEKSGGGGTGKATVSEIVVVALTLPAKPATVTVAVPRVAALVAENNIADTKPPLTGVVSWNLAVTPLGSPLAVNVGMPLNPVTAVAWMVLCTMTPEPATTVTLDGLALIAKSETGGTTWSWIATVCVRAPLVPVIVTVELLNGTELDEENTMLAPFEFGATVADVPEGTPLTWKVTVPVNPPLGVTVTWVLAGLSPAGTETLEGLAESEKSGPAANTAPDAAPAPPRATASTSVDSSPIRSMARPPYPALL
jgi:hypothetical protein